MRPLKGKLIVELELEPEITASGLHIKTRKLQRTPNTGKVYAIAEDITDFKVGDRVIFHDPNARGFKWHGLNLIDLKHEQIVGIFR